MSTRVLALAAIGAAICITIGVLLGSAVTKSSDNKAALSAAQLLQRIEDLTARVEQLENGQPAVTFRAANAPPTIVAPELPREQLPDGWSRHEFNGQHYYIAPLASSQPDTRK